MNPAIENAQIKNKQLVVNEAILINHSKHKIKKNPELFMTNSRAKYSKSLNSGQQEFKLIYSSKYRQVKG